MTHQEFNPYEALRLAPETQKSLFEAVAFYISLVACVTLLSIISGIIFAQFTEALHAISLMRILNAAITAVLAARIITAKRLHGAWHVGALAAAMIASQGQEIIALLYVAALARFPVKSL